MQAKLNPAEYRRRMFACKTKIAFLNFLIDYLERFSEADILRKTIEIFFVFLKIGLTAFGGPAVHIALFENEVVSKRKWMDRQHFLDLVGATNLIPGPNSTEMAIHCGYHRAGIAGMFAAGFRLQTRTKSGQRLETNFNCPDRGSF